MMRAREKSAVPRCCPVGPPRRGSDGKRLSLIACSISVVAHPSFVYFESGRGEGGLILSSSGRSGSGWWNCGMPSSAAPSKKKLAAVVGWLIHVAAARGVQVEADADQLERVGLTRIVQHVVVRSMGRGASVLLEVVARVILFLLALLLSWSPSTRAMAIHRVASHLRRHADQLQRYTAPCTIEMQLRMASIWSAEPLSSLLLPVLPAQTWRAGFHRNLRACGLQTSCRWGRRAQV